MRKIAVIGGDGRAEALAVLCEAQGDRVSTYGLRAEDEKTCLIEEADALLFPYPFSVKEGNVPNLRGILINPTEVLERAKAGVSLLVGEGMGPWLAYFKAFDQNAQIFAYNQDQGFLQANADISAEGALCYAMRQLPCTLDHARCLVVGYGLFGRALAQKMKALGGLVTVAARSEEAREKAQADGMEAIALQDLPMAKVAPFLRLLFNTVPAQVIGEGVLNSLPSNALLLELASAPYGFSKPQAEARGLAVAVLPGIPAHYAPESAAKALFDAMKRLTGGVF